jgi:peptidoglycan/LPS O-acetylase OafA/YrhL
LTQAISYRPDIDGLRAVAVLSVVFFHLEASLVPGGFVGVDIFFVISGFLITSILRREMEAGTFSFGEFYLRRIRRIAPAYFAMVAATLAAGCFLLAPRDLAALGESALWSSLSVPNIHFWRAVDTGYFAADSRQLPLLHLWSLGVEEQFYLVWPALLLALIKLPRRPLLGLLMVFSAWSFLFAQLRIGTDASFAYYMLPTRAGELGIGALLALSPTIHDKRDGGVGHELLAIAGLALIAASLLLLDGSSSFPGLNALYPCMGTALLILAGSRRECRTVAFLRWPPVVWVGLISYSLYLWHWPVLALLRYFQPSPGLPMLLCASAAILALSVASYYAIERPCRHTGMPRRRQPVLLYALPVAALVSASLVAIMLPERIGAVGDRLAYSRAERNLKAHTAPAFEYSYNCQLSTFDPGVLARPDCVHGVGRPGATRALLWGDSHAAHYIGVIAMLAERDGFALRNASLSTCPPILGSQHAYGAGEYRSHCTRFLSYMASSIDDYQTLYLGAQWRIHFRHPDFDRDLESTLKLLVSRGKTVVLLGQAPEFPGYDRNCELRNLRHAIMDCRALAERGDPGIEAHNRRLQELAARMNGVRYLDVRAVLCTNGRCSPYLDGRPVYFDHSHLSMDGSWVVGKHLWYPDTAGTSAHSARRAAEGT